QGTRAGAKRSRLTRFCRNSPSTLTFDRAEGFHVRRRSPPAVGGERVKPIATAIAALVRSATPGALAQPTGYEQPQGNPQNGPDQSYQGYPGYGPDHSAQPPPGP